MTKKNTCASDPVILPRVPSKLIYIALADLAKAEKSKKYMVIMGIWHWPTIDWCAVCFAGSVMAFSLNADPTDSLGPSSMPANYDQLLAINFLRVGGVFHAYRQLGLQGADLNTNIRPYKDNPDGFRRDMKNLAAKLEREGL